ncbi:hypothetical protein [Thermogemmatispora tikiterensis]|uniref:NurA domain-containing protein n=1 Tax=Thermogemmatispora tikiterensis TaxID=1825093 RepID=A0A328V8M7_9CHLR|nr:hypothetical protein [Thermogemmatispora tikiterensis]RAQ93966.1 hypothetical protein A4R35_00380 [Thermogemmatispora tikiterensis]
MTRIGGLDFLKNNGARRVRNDQPRPWLIEEGNEVIVEEVREELLNYERSREHWAGIDVLSARPPVDWPWWPRRFVDGKNVGRTVAWLQTREGFPVPVRLAEIGAAALIDQAGLLRREYEAVERVVSLAVEGFPWDEVESFAAALGEHDLRLLPCHPSPMSYSFEQMRRAVQNRMQEEMDLLMRRALACNLQLPTLVDGRLEPCVGAFDQDSAPIVGLIKTHARVYLPSRELPLLYELEPGQRTPAFCIGGKLPLVTWYLRLNPLGSELPYWGLVRLEISRSFYEGFIGGDPRYIDYLSHIIYSYRCKNHSYGRAAISIYPIQRVEETLEALFTPNEMLVQRFYRYTNI